MLRRLLGRSKAASDRSFVIAGEKQEATTCLLECAIVGEDDRGVREEVLRHLAAEALRTVKGARAVRVSVNTTSGGSSSDLFQRKIPQSKIDCETGAGAGSSQASNKARARLEQGRTTRL